MVRHGWTRFASALFVLWFSFVSSEPPALHICALHDHSAPAAASHGSHGHAHTSGNPAQSHKGHSCSCMGTCCASAPARLDNTVALLDAPTIAATEPASFHAPSVAPASPFHHLRPPSIGPPLLHTV